MVELAFCWAVRRMPSASAASSSWRSASCRTSDSRFGIGGYQQTGLPGIHPRLRAVEPRAEYLGRGKMQMNLLAFHPDVARLQAGEVNAGNHFSVDQEQQAISRQKIREDGIFLGAADDFVHGVDHGFQPLQSLDAIRQRWAGSHQC